MTLTWVATARERIEGSSCPAGQSPMATRCRICSMIWRYIGRGSTREMERALCIYSIHSIYGWAPQTSRRLDGAQAARDMQPLMDHSRASQGRVATLESLCTEGISMRIVVVVALLGTL